TDCARFMLDPEGRVTSWNTGAERIKGYRPEEIIGQHMSRFYPEEDVRRGKPAAELVHARQSGRFEDEGWRVRKDGSRFWANVVISAVRDDAGRLQGFAKVTRDITERKRAEEALRDANTFLDSIVENIPHMICVKDAQELRFVRFNKAGEQLLGYSKDELVGKNDYDFFPRREADFFTSKDREVLEGRRLVDIPEEPIDTRQRGTRILHTKKIPIGDEGAAPRYLLALSEDITERKQAEEALREARQEVERASHAKTEFLSRVSHELRTPLNAILGFGQLLDRQNPTETQRARIGHILSAGKHLLGLINEVLDISRIEAGKLQLSLEPVCVADALEETLDLLRPLAAERKTEISADSEMDASVYVLADRQRFKQVLLNLLTNGVKYTPQFGQVTASYRAEGENIRITVSDTGPGIPADKRERLFMPFERLGAEQSNVEGTGLGLALSQRLMHVMGGSIGVDPSAGKGSKFLLELPRTNPT